MYWYYKYPLIILLGLLGVGIAYLVWRSLPDSLTQGLIHPFTNALQTERVSVPGPKATSAQAPVPKLAPGSAPAPVPLLPQTPKPAPATDPAPGAAVAHPPVPATPPAQGLPATLVGPPGQPAPAVTVKPSPTVPLPLPAVPPPAPDDAARILDTARKQVEGYNYIAARQLAARVFDLPGVTEFDRSWFEAAELVSRINAVFMSSETASPERKGYTVQPGDSLSRIALRLNTTVGALQRINGLEPTNPVIYPGNVLYTLNVEWAIRVVKSKYVLLLLNGKDLFRLYHIGVGRENKTPIGTFLITSKVIHPAWTPPGRTFPYGHPENPLGTHWLGLSPVEGTDPTLSGYGLHGSWEPKTIGTAASEGCVRMLNEQISELFDFIPEPGRGPAVRVVIED